MFTGRLWFAIFCRICCSVWGEMRLRVSSWLTRARVRSAKPDDYQTQINDFDLR